MGLIATDGNLSIDGRHLAIPSIDLELLESIKSCLGLTNAITRQKSERSHIHRLQWGDRLFYGWLVSLGLTPRKSRTLGPLAIPDEYFADFFRGCIDGDGTVLVYTDRYHVPRNRRYVYERLYVSLVSGSRLFVEWVQATIQRLTGAGGAIHLQIKRGHQPIHVLRYAKRESIIVLRWMYYSLDVPCLARKRAKASPFLLPCS